MEIAGKRGAAARGSGFGYAGAQCAGTARKRGKCAIAALWLLLVTPAVACTDPAAASYPAQLHGTWVGEMSDCPAPDEGYDGEQILTITSGQLQGYEDRSVPTSVTLISTEPVAWRIESLVDVGPSGIYSEDAPRVFVLGNDRLTVASKLSADTYRRCGDDRRPPPLQ